MEEMLSSESDSFEDFLIKINKPLVKPCFDDLLANEPRRREVECDSGNFEKQIWSSDSSVQISTKSNIVEELGLFVSPAENKKTLDIEKPICKTKGRKPAGKIKKAKAKPKKAVVKKRRAKKIVELSFNVPSFSEFDNYELIVESKKNSAKILDSFTTPSIINSDVKKPFSKGNPSEPWPSSPNIFDDTCTNFESRVNNRSESNPEGCEFLSNHTDSPIIGFKKLTNIQTSTPQPSEVRKISPVITDGQIQDSVENKVDHEEFSNVQSPRNPLCNIDNTSICTKEINPHMLQSPLVSDKNMENNQDSGIHSNGSNKEHIVKTPPDDQVQLIRESFYSSDSDHDYLRLDSSNSDSEFPQTVASLLKSENVAPAKNCVPAIDEKEGANTLENCVPDIYKNDLSKTIEYDILDICENEVYYSDSNEICEQVENFVSEPIESVDSEPVEIVDSEPVESVDFKPGEGIVSETAGCEISESVGSKAHGSVLNYASAIVKIETSEILENYVPLIVNGVPVTVGKEPPNKIESDVQEMVINDRFGIVKLEVLTKRENEDDIQALKLFKNNTVAESEDSVHVVDTAIPVLIKCTVPVPEAKVYPFELKKDLSSLSENSPLVIFENTSNLKRKKKEGILKLFKQKYVPEMKKLKSVTVSVEQLNMSNLSHNQVISFDVDMPACELTFLEQSLISQTNNIWESLSQSQLHVQLEDKILTLCDQPEVLDLGTMMSRKELISAKKIGEGAYAEVFQMKCHKELTVLKILPIEGVSGYGDKQISFNDVLSEILISKEINGLTTNEENQAEVFIEVKRVSYAKGIFPPKLLKEWQKYHRERKSENDYPGYLPSHQKYIIFQFSYGGLDLENFEFKNGKEITSVLKQIMIGVAVAEAAYNFEHRDLHEGNILVSRTKRKNAEFKLKGKDIVIPTNGCEIRIIDFTLSRLDKDGITIYKDLDDPSLFNGEGDSQYDVYRYMKKQTKNNWQTFCPMTNILWLQFLLDRLSKKHEKILKMDTISNNLLKSWDKITKKCSTSVDLVEKIFS